MRPALALVVVLALSRPADSAPVPPARPLSEAGLVGTWEQTWGSGYKGPVTFSPDGTYLFVSDEGLFSARFAGRWWLDGGTLVLIESRVSECGGIPTRYEVRVAPAGSEVTGTVGGSGAEFRLTAPRR